MQDTYYSVGPKFFGTHAKKSWFDEGDRCAPGPGSHEPARLNEESPPNWTIGKGTARDGFLQKHTRQTPLADHYKVGHLDTTHPAQPKHLVPKYEVRENPNKVDEGSAADYRPHHNFPKGKRPNYSFGYTFQKDFSSNVPSPDIYNPKRVDKKSFNKTQKSFSVGERPTPYGQEGKYPYVGKYNVGGNMGGSKYSIGKTTRPGSRAGAAADGDYHIGGNILKTGQGKTVGLLIAVPPNKDQEEFPPPNHYNPIAPRTDRNIINYRSKRHQIKNQAVEKFPSPDRYGPKLNSKEQTVSFTRQFRQDAEPDPYPGVGTYEVELQLSQTQGTMGLKLKKMTEFINPAPCAYDPSDALTKPQYKRPINCESHRTDFSKSITGRNIGPGVYRVEREEGPQFGKIGKGAKFDPNHNKNPGPGSYELPSSIGKLPKYCSGPKKVTCSGFSVVELERQDRIRRERARFEAQRKLQQEEQDRLLEQQEEVVQ